jgi:hypothetical protein
MSRFVRIAALVFAFFSALYWGGVLELNINAPSIYKVVYGMLSSDTFGWMISVLPIFAYAVICVLFLHWFARRIILLVNLNQKRLIAKNISENRATFTSSPEDKEVP